MRKNTRFDKKFNAKCDHCGKGFFRYITELRRSKHSFCSSSCLGRWNKKNVYNKLNTTCSYCGKAFHRDPSRKKGYVMYFCNKVCQGAYWAKNFIGERSSNWQGGKTEQRKYELQSSKYRKWRANILKGAICIICDSPRALELHHIEYRSSNPLRIRDESNVVPICEECHDLLHSKGGELRETLNAKLAHGNPQANQSNINTNVGWKLQRLMGEDIITNKPDTSTAPERDEIVRACLKEQDVELKSSAITN